MVKDMFYQYFLSTKQFSAPEYLNIFTPKGKNWKWDMGYVSLLK